MILDTDVLIDLARKQSPAYAAAHAWLNSLPEAPTICGIAAMELLFGSLNTHELRDMRKLLSLFTCVWPSGYGMEKAMLGYPELKLKGGLGVLDALIAITAVERLEALVTFNVKHFRDVPGLVTVQPYVR